MASPTKTYEGKYDTCDNNLPVPANSNNSRTRCHDTISVHSKHHIFVPQKQIEMSQNNTLTHGKLQRCQTQRSDMQDSNGNHTDLDLLVKICHSSNYF